MTKKVSDQQKRADIGIYENLMEDFREMANIFIGNETLDEFTEGAVYQPMMHVVADFHFSPENDRVYSELLSKINLIEKKLLKLRVFIDANHAKGKFLYPKG